MAPNIQRVIPTSPHFFRLFLFQFELPTYVMNLAVLKFQVFGLIKEYFVHIYR